MAFETIRRTSYENYGDRGSVLYFDLPVYGEEIESVIWDYNLSIRIYENVPEGESYSFNLYAGMDYYENGSWVQIYKPKWITVSCNDSDNRRTVRWAGEYTGGSSAWRDFLQTIQGKRIRIYSESTKTFYDEDYHGGYLFQNYITYKQPIIGDVAFSRDYTNACVNLSFSNTYTQSYSIAINGKTYTNTKSIPESAFTVGDNAITINAINGDMSSSRSVSYTFVDYNPTAKTMAFTNSTLDYDTTVEVTSTNAQRYDLYVNGVFKYSSSTQVFIPPKSAFSLGENTCFVRCYNTTSGRYADTTTYRKTFTLIQPTISNIIMTNTGSNGNNLTCNPTQVSWQSTNYSYFNVYVGNIKVGANIADTTFTIPAYKVPYGQSTIKVEVVKNALSGIANTQVIKYLNTNISLDSIEPTVSNVKISTTNIDRNIKITWDSKYQEWVEVLTYPSGIDLAPCTTETECIVPAGRIPNTEKGISVEVYMNADGEDISAKEVLHVDFTYDAPIVYNLEPSNLNRNINEPIEVTFATNEYVDSWVVMIGDSILGRASGTVERSVVFGANTFARGENKLTLKVTYKSPYSGATTRTATKTVTFNGYGKPSALRLICDDVYNTSMPTIRWNENDEQVLYDYELYSNNMLIQSGTKDTSDSFVTLNTLLDNTAYSLKVRIKNKYDLYSDWSIAHFNTLFSNITLPEFYLIQNENGVQISVDGYQDVDFKSISIYRKDKFTEWIEIATNLNSVDSIVDYTCACNIETLYKLRVYNVDNAYRDTQAKTIIPALSNYLLTNVEDFTQNKQINFVIDNQYTFNRNIVHKIYSGQASPRTFKGNTRYNAINMTCQFANQDAMDFIQFIETCNDYNIFCYRSWKGERSYVSVRVVDMMPINPLVMSVSIEMTQVNFIETGMYNGSGYRKIVYLDGSYLLDGSIDLSGYDDSVVAPYSEVMTLEEL